MSNVQVSVLVDNQRTDAPKIAQIDGCSFQAIKMSRAVFISEGRRNQDLNKGGVYFQIGSERDEQGRIEIYVGETQSFVDRFTSHSSQHTGLKNWTTAIFFVNGSLERAFRQLLEDALCKMVTDSTNWHLITQRTTPDQNATTGKEYQIARCVEDIWLLSRALGIDFISPTNDSSALTADGPIFECKSPKRHAEAKGFLSANGFTVCAGAMLSDKILPNLKPVGYLRMRNVIEQDHELVSSRKLLKNKEFTNPSIAAAVVLGTTANGYDEWKTSDGVKLGQYLQSIETT